VTIPLRMCLSFIRHASKALLFPANRGCGGALVLIFVYSECRVRLQVSQRQSKDKTN